MAAVKGAERESKQAAGRHLNSQRFSGKQTNKDAGIQAYRGAGN